MNTIPSIFNETLIPYTAVGGKERSALSGISLVVLNPLTHPNRFFFHDIENTGFDKVISIETHAPHYDIEELSGRYPFVRFILPEKELNLGEQINLAAAEIDSPFFFVIRSDMKIISGGNAKRLAEREIERDNNKNRICTVPVIVNSNYEPLPTISSLATKKKKIRTTRFEPQHEGELSLYPYSGIGIYNKERFIQIGGFDATINKTYWQLMDFGFRSFLWGEEIALSLKIKICCDGELPPENTTIEDNYNRFYLKNLAPVFKSDYAHLPLLRFFSFLHISGHDFFSALKEFKEGRRWVKNNKYRWKSDSCGVVDKWSIN